MLVRLYTFEFFHLLYFTALDAACLLWHCPLALRISTASSRWAGHMCTACVHVVGCVRASRHQQQEAKECRITLGTVSPL